MGAKSKRKTKLKHQDFQKAKLKVGKKLPKAQNETRTNFKSRAIVIREQLRMPTTGPPGVDDEKPAKKESKCKYSVKELLTQSHHYNVNKRSSALINIRELFVKNKPLIEVHLSAIIEHLGAMCIDAEGDVRKAWLRLIRIVLSYCKLDVMQPYRSVLCAHLRCAMTHINEEVRRDSLNLLDIYLDCFPQIVVSVNAQVLSCFVSQISRDASKDGGPTPSGQTTMEKRMLLADPGSFVATQKWRLAVLLRLKRFLQVLYNQSVSGATASNTFHEVECDMERVTHAQPFTQDHRDVAAGLGYVKPLSSQSELSASEHETLTDLMQKLFPLLVEIWTEISPQCQHRVEDFTQAGILSVDGFNILDSVLSVFNYLIKLTSSSTESVRHEENLAVIQQWNRFRHRSDREDVSNLSAGSHLASYEEDFYRRFVQHFPYCIAAMPDEEKKLHANKLQTSELSLNLTICAIVTYLLSANQNADLPYGRQLVDYIIESINDNNITMNSEQIKIVLNITKQMLTKKMEKKNNKEMVIQLLHGIMVVYRKQTTMTTEKRLIIDFFYSILASGLPCHNETYFVNILQVWHTSLPYFLAKPRQLDVTFADVSKLVTIIRQAVNKYNCKATKQQLLKYSLQIMGSLPLYSSSIQRNVMSLILCFDELRKEHFKVLAQVALNMKRFPLENVSYLIEVLIYKYSLLKQESGLFLSFLLSLISGSMQTDLRRLNEVLSESSAHISQQIHYGGITEGQWKRTTSVARICCQYIYGMNRHEDHITILYSAFSTICVDHTYLPLCTAHNLLYAVSVLNTHYCTQPSDVVQSMLERLLVQILKLIDSLLLISVSGDCIVMAGKREKKKFPEVRETNPNLGVSEGDLSTTENMEVDDTEPATGPSSEPVTDPQANLHTISDNIKAELQQTCISVLMSDVRWHSQTFLQAFIQQQIQNVKATQDLSVVLRRLCFVLTRLRQQKYRSLTSEENKQFSIMALLIQEQSKTVAVDDAILSDFNYECKLIMK